MNKYLILLSAIILSACTTTHVDSGYVTQEDPLRHECINGEVWVVNDSGRVNLESYYLGDECGSLE
jgi:hypothetical protein